MTNRVMQLFAMYDRTTEIWGALFPAENAAVAIRAFQNSILRPQSTSDISENPDDFELFQVGEYDHSTGKLVPSKIGKPLITGTQVKASKPAVQ